MQFDLLRIISALTKSMNISVQHRADKIVADSFVFCRDRSNWMLLYDFFSLTQPSAPVALPRIPKSIAVVGTVAEHLEAI